MNRLLENNIKIKMVRTNTLTYAVDTQEDLNNVEKLMKNDNLNSKYN
jgi:CMP-2-keto-3-deoxyoctulosonic acid synthetase